MAWWALGALVIGVRRRRAGIFTADSFVFRPVFGKLQRIPMNGIKHVIELDMSREEYPTPTVHIEFLVGGAVDIQLGLPKADEIIIDRAAAMASISK